MYEDKNKIKKIKLKEKRDIDVKSLTRMRLKDLKK